VRPHSSPVALAQPSATAGAGHVLAREPGREHVYRLYRTPVDSGDIAEVGHRREAVREDRGRAGVIISHPGELTAEYGVNGHPEALITRAE
jgi:hypothetical protein